MPVSQPRSEYERRLGLVALEELLHLVLGEVGRVASGSSALQHRAEREEIGLRVERALHHREPARRPAPALEQLGAALIGRELGVLGEEAVEQQAALPVDEALQVGGAPGIVRIVEHAPGDAVLPEQGVIDDLAHQPHEGQVHRVAEGGAQRHHALVVGLVEVREPVQAAAGEEDRARGWRRSAARARRRAARRA